MSDTGLPSGPAPGPNSGADAHVAACVPAPRPIHLVHRGQMHQVSGLPSTTSVLGWLREHRRCTGTKEGCNEGDCGACTVLLAELDEAGTGLQLKPVNSCIQFLPTLDGKAVVTVEDLGGQHPAQQAMVACHGSQCGFCTPGFVMSLAATLSRHRAALPDAARAAATAAGPVAPSTAPAATPSRQTLADDLSGNLCRCTGYRPILDAGEQMFGLADHTDWAPTIAALQALRALALPPLHYADATPLHAPRTLDDLAALRLAKPQARLLAGSTDIGLWVNKQFRALGEVIYLGEVAALKAITRLPDGGLAIGAGASLQAAWTALAEDWPALREMGLRFASRPVREAGTLGGNIANGSPIGDGAPVLMALDAQLLLRRGNATRRLPLASFYLGYQRSALAEGEFLQAIELPAPSALGGTLRAYKLSKRYDCDISAVACGLWLALDAAGRVSAARLAFGGLAATVQRAAATEAALVGQPWTEPTLRAAQAALAQDFQPLTDLRASAAHRGRSARALLERFWLETRPLAPLLPGQVSVRSAA